MTEAVDDEKLVEFGDIEGTAKVTRAERALAFLGVLFTLIAMFHITANVLMRYLFESPIRATLEMTGYWYLPLICIVGFVIAQLRNSHIEAELLYAQMPAKVQVDLLRFGFLIAAVTSAAFTYYTGHEALEAFEKRETAGALRVMIWPVKLAVPVTFAVLTVLFGLAMLRVRSLPDKSTMKDWGARAGLVVAIGVLVTGIFAGSSSEIIGISAILLMLLLLFLKVPVAFALSGPGLLGLWNIRPRAVITVMSEGPYSAISQWSLSVVPMFIFMGFLLWKSGLTTKIYAAARAWLSWLPGGLGVSTTFAGTGLAAVSGSTIGTTYALAQIGIPEMLKSGYDRRIAVGSVMIAGLPGQLIPPSTFLVIYSGIAQVPIGPQLMAGVVPGLLVSVVFGLAIVLLGLTRPKMVGQARKQASTVTWSERWSGLGSIWTLPILILMVLGGMYTGVFTATEAGAAGAIGGLLICILYQKGRAPRIIIEAATETVKSTGAIFLLIIGAHIMSDLLTLTGLARDFTSWVNEAGLSRWQFLCIVLLGYIILGMFMDPLLIMILTVPLLVPSLTGLDVSLLWFGVFVVLTAELAILTPPVGILSFIVHGITRSREVNQGQEISLQDIFVAVLWFMPIAILFALILIAFPALATWLPSQM